MTHTYVIKNLSVFVITGGSKGIHLYFVIKYIRYLYDFSTNYAIQLNNILFKKSSNLFRPSRTKNAACEILKSTEVLRVNTILTRYHNRNGITDILVHTSTTTLID